MSWTDQPAYVETFTLSLLNHDDYPQFPGRKGKGPGPAHHGLLSAGLVLVNYSIQKFTFNKAPSPSIKNPKSNAFFPVTRQHCCEQIRCDIRSPSHHQHDDSRAGSDPLEPHTVWEGRLPLTRDRVLAIGGRARAAKSGRGRSSSS